MPTLTQLLNSLNESQAQQVELLKQLKEARPKYICAQAFTLFGPATVKLADDDEKGVLRAEAHWTPTCVEYIENEEFRYISAEFDRDYYSEKDGKHIGSCLLAVGLTNRPFVKGMEPVTLRDDGQTSFIDVITTGHWYHLWYGEFTVTLEDLEQMVENKDRCLSHVDGDSEHGPTELVIDYNHGSLAYGPENSKAAGWVRGKGIWVEKKTKKASVTKPAQTLNAPASPSAQPASQPQLGGNTVNDELIREILGLAEGVEVTEDHRNKVLVKLHEQNTALDAGHQALVGVVGDIDPAQVSVQLKAGQINGFVVLKASEHETLVKAQQDLAEIQNSDGDDPVIKLGKVVLTEAKFNELQGDAKKGAKAAEDLLELNVDTFLDENQNKFTEAQRPALRANLVKDFDTWSDDIKNRPDLDEGLFKFTGPSEPSDQSKTVAKFISSRESELVGEGKAAHEAYSIACREAKAEFGDVTYGEWEEDLAQAS